MTDEKRPYRKQRRGELEQATHQRLVESAAELHGTLGPSRTSLSAIAAHAGVRRSTLYRHFADEAALFTACTGHWMAANPVPDLARWAETADPDERIRIALAELYPHYRSTEQMMSNILRDEETMPIVAERFAPFRGYLAAAHETLMAGRRARGAARRRLLAATGHSLAFTTWRSLARDQGLDDAQAAELMLRLVSGCTGPPRKPSAPPAPRG